MKYEHPQVEIIEVEVEQGFATSNDFIIDGWDSDGTDNGGLAE